ncbi:hypothetical protein D9M70_505040 [compost metagenome]
MFGDGIGEGVRDDGEGVGRGDVEDDAATRGDHARQHGLAAVPRALEVDVEAALPVGIREFQRLEEHVDAGIVDQRIRLADLAVRRGNRLFDGIRIRDVGRGVTDLSARRTEPLSLSRQQIPITIDEVEARAFRKEGLGNSKADALSRPSDDDALSFETTRHVRAPHHSATLPSAWRQIGLRQRWPSFARSMTYCSSTSMPRPGPCGIDTKPSA